MTCIVGLETEHGTWLGSDSYSGNDGWRSTCDPSRKIVQVDEGGLLAVGLSGSWSLRQVLMTARIGLDVRPNDEVALFQYIAAWRRQATESGFSTTENGATLTPNGGGGAMLIAYKGRLWRVGGDWSLTKSPPFEAIGSGANYAEGALAVTGNLLPAEERVKAALNAAAGLCPTVSRPFFTHWQAVP